MTTMECPWCSSELELETVHIDAAEDRCPSCSSSWLVEDSAGEWLVLAA